MGTKSVEVAGGVGGFGTFSRCVAVLSPLAILSRWCPGD